MNFLTYVFTVTAFSCIATAETPKDAFPTLSFGAFPLPIVRSYISFNAGTPASKAKLNDPFPNDFPPHIVTGLEDRRSYPAIKKGARYFFPGQNILRVYRISDARQYRTIQPHLAFLQTVLRERPTTLPDSGSAYRHLPDYPPRNSGHAYQLKLSYVDAPWGRGVFYLTQFVQGPGNYANNEEMTGIFQGISNDGAFYISADFRVTHPNLPFGIDATKHHDDEFKTDSAMLAKQPDNSFNPPLKKLRDWLTSLKLE